jgi:hypothetical protein
MLLFADLERAANVRGVVLDFFVRAKGGDDNEHHLHPERRSYFLLFYSRAYEDAYFRQVVPFQLIINECLVNGEIVSLRRIHHGTPRQQMARYMQITSKCIAANV